MESQELQPQSEDIKPPETPTVVESTSVSTLSPVDQSVKKGKWILSEVTEFLAQIPNYVGDFFNQYKQLIISVALFLAAIATLRIVAAVVGAINDIPLLRPTFQLIGLGYFVWFVTRYLLKPESRQELIQTIQMFLNKQT